MSSGNEHSTKKGMLKLVELALARARAEVWLETAREKRSSPFIIRKFEDSFNQKKKDYEELKQELGLDSLSDIFLSLCECQARCEADIQRKFFDPDTPLVCLEELFFYLTSWRTTLENTGKEEDETEYSNKELVERAKKVESQTEIVSILSELIGRVRSFFEKALFDLEIEEQLELREDSGFKSNKDYLDLFKKEK